MTVNFATANGTARRGADFAPASGLLSFAPGETVKIVSVKVRGDADAEPDESFSVNLSGASGATIFDGQGAGTISNDD